MARHTGTYPYIGESQTVAIPSDYAGGFTFDIRSPSGGGADAPSGFGGLGGRVTGKAAPVIADTLTLYVAGLDEAIFGYTLGGATVSGGDGSIAWTGGRGGNSSALLLNGTLVAVAGAGGGGGGGAGGGSAGGNGGQFPGYGYPGHPAAFGTVGAVGSPGTVGSGGAGAGGGGNGAGGSGGVGGLGGAGSAAAPYGGSGGSGGAGASGGGGGGGSGPYTQVSLGISITSPAAGSGGGGGTSAAGAAATLPVTFIDGVVPGAGSIILTWLVAPVATVTAPTGTITATSTPAISFTYASSESTPMQSFRIVVFSKPGSSWPAGLDGTGNYSGSLTPLIPIYDTGTVYAAALPPGITIGSSSTATLPVPLPNGDLRAYVTEMDSAGVDSTSSGWVFTEWTQNVAGPGAPTVVVTPDAVHARIQFAITPASGLASSVIKIERSLDGGTTYTTIAGGAAIPVPGAFTTYDYYAPREAAITYRITPTNTATVGVPLLGTAWTGATWLNSDSNTWIMCSANPSLNAVQDYQGPNLSGTRHTDQTVYYPEGVTDAVIFGGTMHAEGFVPGMGSNSVTFLFTNDAQYNNFMAIAATQQPVLLKTVYGDISGLEQFWVVLGADLAVMRQGGESRMGSGINGRGPQIRSALIDLYVVAEPT